MFGEVVPLYWFLFNDNSLMNFSQQTWMFNISFTVAFANDYACKGLDRIEEKLPFIHQSSNQVWIYWIYREAAGNFQWLNWRFNYHVEFKCLVGLIIVNSIGFVCLSLMLFSSWFRKNSSLLILYFIGLLDNPYLTKTLILYSSGLRYL